VYGRPPDDDLLIFFYLFPPELSEEEAEDVLFKEVGCFFFEDSETLYDAIYEIVIPVLKMLLQNFHFY
jgi:hypothetical protein